MFYSKLYDLLKESDAIMLTSPHNLRYFTGFKGGEGIAIIGSAFRILLVDSRYTVAAKTEAVDFSVLEFSGGKLQQNITDIFSEKNIKTILFEDLYMNVFEFEKIKKNNISVDFKGVGDKLDALRMIKTDEEISFIREAEHIGDIAFKKVLPLLKVGVTECEIAAELEYQMRLLGSDGTSFETIVVSGYKTSMPHGKPDSKKIEKGDFVTMDFGCVYKGYCSDMTRTVVIEMVSEEQQKIYNTVLKAQLAGLNGIKAGISGKNADKIARDIINNAGFGRFFGHSLGHGVGMLVHEQPNLSPLSDTILKENTVVSCEPGIYIEGVGGVRIEDLVVIKKDGIENLTHSPKELIICG